MTGERSIRGSADAFNWRVEHVIEASGLRRLNCLTPTPDMAEVLNDLRDLAAVILVDDLERALLRESAIQALKDARVRSAARLVDAVLSRPVGRDTDETASGTRAIVPQREPWPEPVAGAELLVELVAAVRRHVVLGEHEAVAIALWVLHTYCIDAAEISPRLALLSPTKRCGKTTTLKLLQALVAKPIAASNISSAALFRIVDAEHPTVLIDEADSFMRGNEELRNILNAGHDRATAHVVRCGSKDEDFAPIVFSAWSAVAIAAIGELPGTLADRSIAIRLRRSGKADNVFHLRRREQKALGPIAQRCSRWADDHIRDLGQATLEDLPLSSDRAADNWAPLVAIASLAGGTEWRELALSAAQALTATADAEDASTEVGERLLNDIRILFEIDAISDRVSMQELASALADIDGSPWQEVAGKTHHDELPRQAPLSVRREG